MLEAPGLRGIVEDGLARRTVEAVDREDDVVLVQLIELAQVAADGQALAFLNEAVQRLGAFAARGDRVDGELRAGVDVAADEDVGLLGR